MRNFWISATLVLLFAAKLCAASPLPGPQLVAAPKDASLEKKIADLQKEVARLGTEVSDLKKENVKELKELQDLDEKPEKIDPKTILQLQKQVLDLQNQIAKVSAAKGSDSGGNFSLPYKGGAQAGGAVFDVTNMTNGPGAIGVSGTGEGIGVRGTSKTGRGVEGHSDSKGGVVGTSESGNGVSGVSHSQTAAGIFGEGHRAGIFKGNVGISGDLLVENDLFTSGKIASHIKFFHIDHPLEPSKKYLNHSSVESSEVMNLYTGEVLLDNYGEAILQLPDWFEALNKDFRYQLTAIGAPGPNLYIAKKIANNRFKIAGGQPGSEVSWQVTGLRHDAWIVANPLKVEEEKQGIERGTYLDPELFGQPVEKGLAWVKPIGLPLSEEEALLAATSKRENRSASVFVNPNASPSGTPENSNQARAQE